MALGKRRISITPRELDALSRVAYAESRTINDPRKYNSVVDAINNREAAGGWFGSETEGVVNKRKQFTPINGLGTWANLPGAPQNVTTDITRHLSEQAFGAPQSVPGKPTHYMNPSVPSTAYAQSTWGQGVEGWNTVGQGPVAHAFGAPDGVPPDHSVSLDPETQMGFGQETYSPSSPLNGGIPGTSFGAFGPQTQVSQAAGPMPGSVAGFGPAPGSFDQSYTTPDSVQSVSTVPQAPASPLQPNIDKAKQMLSSLSPLGPAPSFGAPPSATQAEQDAARAALSASLSGPKTISTIATPGLTDAQIGMGPQPTPAAAQSFGALAPSASMPGQAPMSNMATMPGASTPLSAGLAAPSVSVAQPTVSVSAPASAAPSTFGAPAMTGPAPMSTMGTMPGAIGPLSAGLSPTVSQPESAPSVAAPQSGFGAPPASISAPAPMAAMAPAPMSMTPIGPTVQTTNPQETAQATSQQQSSPEVSVTAGMSSPADFARAMAAQTAAKKAAVSATPESKQSIASKIAGALGMGSKSGGMGGSSTGGSSSSSSSGSKSSSKSSRGVSHGGKAQGSAHSSSSHGKRGTGASTRGGR